MYLGGELVLDIFVRGSVYLLRDVVRTYVFLFFSLLSRYIVLTL